MSPKIYDFFLIVQWLNQLAGIYGLWFNVNQRIECGKIELK